MKQKFSHQLQAFRERKRWTAHMIAEYLSGIVGREISDKSIVNWMNGLREPHPIWRAKIEEAIRQ